MIRCKYIDTDTNKRCIINTRNGDLCHKHKDKHVSTNITNIIENILRCDIKYVSYDITNKKLDIFK